MNDKLIKVGITQGDINGIAYELIIKMLEDARIFELCIPVIYGSSKVLAYHRRALELPALSTNSVLNGSEASINRVNLVACGGEELMVELSHQTSHSVEAADLSIKKAIEDLNEGNIQVLLMPPAIDDYTSLIESKAGKGKQALQMFVKDGFRVAVATDKMPVSEIAASLSVETLTEKIKILHESLVHDFMLTAPRIAILSLNPQVKEKEYAGTEEDAIIIPALTAATEAGIYCFGPYSADKFFGSDEYVKFDAVLAMYSDQALIPFNMITENEGVYYIAGLPAIAMATNQSVSYELAGKNRSSENALRNALYQAVDIFHNRILDKEIYAHPLKKLYFERGSDNEKLDLTKDEA